MTKHAFLEGMGLGVLAGTAIGLFVAVTPSCNHEMRRMARKAARQIDHVKDDLSDRMGF